MIVFGHLMIQFQDQGKIRGNTIYGLTDVHFPSFLGIEISFIVLNNCYCFVFNDNKIFLPSNHDLVPISSIY
jgi:hypothetical protein